MRRRIFADPRLRRLRPRYIGTQRGIARAGAEWLTFALTLTLLFSAFSYLTICFYAEGVTKAQTLGPQGHIHLAGWREGGSLHLGIDGAVFAFEEVSPYPRRDAGADPSRARAPVAGVVAQVLVRPGDRVAAGQPLASVEAMKMEMWLHAAADGTVRQVHARTQAPVAAGAVLIELELGE